MTDGQGGRYALYGLVVQSGVELPELAPAPADVPADVQIDLGEVPERLDGGLFHMPEMQVKGDDCIVDIPEVGRYRITAGKTILLQPWAGAAPGDVRAFLFGIAFGALLHQRRLIPLHLSAVATPYGVWAFTGESGAGKSTTAGMLNRMTGWPLLCDDVAVLDPAEEVPLLHTGMRRLKLWNDAVDRFQLDGSRLVRDLARYDKFHVVAPEIFDTTPRRLSALFQLGVADQWSVTPIRGAKAFQTVINAVYRPAFANLFGDLGELSRHCAKVANAIEVHDFVRPWNGDALEESLAHLVRFLGEGRTGLERA